MCCSLLQELYITNFDTPEVVGMSWMFSGYINLNKHDLTKFDTQNVSSVKCMFEWCYILNH